MPEQRLPTSQSETARRQLEALADEMFRRGFFAKVATGGNPPFVTVINKNAAQLTEDVYAAPAGDGTWWLRWSWAEKLTRVDDVATAAGAIAWVLTPVPPRGRPYVA